MIKTKRIKAQLRTDGNRGLTARTLEALGAMPWFLIRLPSQKEFVAERILDDAGLIVFVPEEVKFRKSSRYAKRTDPKRAIRYPLIAGYALVAFPPGRDWGDLFRFSLVLGVISRAGAPAVIPFAQVERLLRRHSAGEFVAPRAQQWMRTYREFAVGDRVEVLDGPFEGRVFDVTEIRGQAAPVIISILGGEQEVEIPLRMLGRVA